MPEPVVTVVEVASVADSDSVDISDSDAPAQLKLAEELSQPRRSARRCSKEIFLDKQGARVATRQMKHKAPHIRSLMRWRLRNEYGSDDVFRLRQHFERRAHERVHRMQRHHSLPIAVPRYPGRGPDAKTQEFLEEQEFHIYEDEINMASRHSNARLLLRASAPVLSNASLRGEEPDNQNWKDDFEQFYQPEEKLFEHSELQKGDTTSATSGRKDAIPKDRKGSFLLVGKGFAPQERQREEYDQLPKVNETGEAIPRDVLEAVTGGAAEARQKGLRNLRRMSGDEKHQSFLERAASTVTGSFHKAVEATREYAQERHREEMFQRSLEAWKREALLEPYDEQYARDLLPR
ncbi:MAG: hypothetical protein MHM6MM_002530 [Cercozoa sp. M6MM]